MLLLGCAEGRGLSGGAYPPPRCCWNQKFSMGKKLYANQGFWVNEGTPGNSFKICTDILLDKPSILAEETLLCTIFFLRE